MSFSRLLGTTILFCLPTILVAQDDISFDELMTPSPELRSLLGDIPSLDGSLEEQIARMSEDEARRGGNPKTVHILVDFAKQPNAEMFEALREIGAQVLGKVAQGVWAVGLDPESAPRIAGIEMIGNAQLFPVAAKISPLFTAERIGDDAPFEEGGEISVTFFEDVSESEARAALESIGVRAAETPKQAFPLSRTLPAVLPEGGLLSIALLDDVRMIEPPALPDIPFNLANAQPLSNVDDVQAPPFELDGAGVTMGIWEAGAVVRATHQELTPRVTVQPGQTSAQSRHALHVAGTMASSGTNTPATEGMAPAANLLSWDAPNDFAEMTTAAAAAARPRIPVSNHSYGQRIGWDPRTRTWNGQALFGVYTAGGSAALDTVIAGNVTGTVAATELVSVWAAGNDRNDRPIAGITGGPQDCFQGGLATPGGVPFAADCLGPDAVAKNIITVGAMNGATAIAGFSSYGPTDDGRIKPDLMAHGVNTLSLGDQPPAAQTDTGTSFSSGTSMAAPVVAGIAGLMTEEFADRKLTPLAASYKAILIQTARDVAGIGQALPGPDFATGWGIADAEAALQLISRGGGPGFAEGTLAATGPGGAWTFPFVVPSGTPEVRVTLAWSDPPSGAGGGLVNDLDLRLIPPGGGGSQPFTTNAASPWLAAGRGDNTTDNVEQVLVASPASGTWTARVTAKPGSLAAAPQRFAIAGPLTPDAGPIAGPKADIVMVLDKSGSMRLPAATAGLTKMQSLQGAATAMVDYLELVGGHGLSIVAFDSGVAATTPNVGLGPLDATRGDSARQAIGNLAPGGTTGIIAGVTEAATRLASPAASNPQSAVVLFSDGRHNSPPGSDVSAIDMVMDDETRFFSIGYGSDVDSTVMPGVAANHAGVHLEEQGLFAGQLAKLFMVVAGLAADEQIIVDPDYAIEPNKIARQRLLVAPEDRTLTFAVFWDEPGRAMDFLVGGPDRRCKINDANHEGYAGRNGKRHRIIRITLPYTCKGGPVDGVALHDGPWELQVRNRDGGTAKVKIMALADSTTRLSADIDVEGRDATITARLKSGGELVTKGLRIRAEILPNKPPTGDSLEQDRKGGMGRDTGFDPDILILPERGGSVVFGGGADALSSDDIGSRIVVDPGRIREDLFSRGRELEISPDLMRRLLQGINRFPNQPVQPAQPVTVDLRDDGQGADKRAGDGIFTARLRASEPVLHNVRVMSELAGPEGLLTREYLTSFAVR